MANKYVQNILKIYICICCPYPSQLLQTISLIDYLLLLKGADMWVVESEYRKGNHRNIKASRLQHHRTA